MTNHPVSCRREGGCPMRKVFVMFVGTRWEAINHSLPRAAFTLYGGSGLRIHGGHLYLCPCLPALLARFNGSPVRNMGRSLRVRPTFFNLLLPRKPQSPSTNLSLCCIRKGSLDNVSCAINKHLHE